MLRSKVMPPKSRHNEHLPPPNNLGHPTSTQSTHLCVQRIDVSSYVQNILTHDGDIMELAYIFWIQIDEWSIKVNNHCVVHAIYFLLPIELRSMSKIVLGLPNFNESPINESDTTLKLGHIMGKGFSFLLVRPWNLVTNRIINVGGNENCIITYCRFTLIPHEGIIHDYIIMFHV